MRQTFTLEVGALAETVTVAGEAPLIETAASLQTDSLGSQEVRELPVNRRNLTNLMSLTAGVNVSGDGMVQMNGVAAGGTGLTVDGTEANSNPEARSLAQYGGQNQISVMSLDSISEVQIVKGVLPAEYGGVAGGQINVISRSGTNIFHGSAFYSGQNEKWNARNFFSTAHAARRHVQSVRRHARRPRAAEQGVLLRDLRGLSREHPAEPEHDGAVSGGPRRDSAGAAVSGDQDRARHPQSADRAHRLVGGRRQYAGRHAGAGSGRGSAPRTTSSPRPTFPCSTAPISASPTRGCGPFTLEPRPVLNNANDREFPNEQDRIAAQFVMTKGAWVSESRVGWNKTYLARLDGFLSTIGPNTPAGDSARTAAASGRLDISAACSRRRMPKSGTWRGTTYSFEQKFSRGFQRHLVKAGFRFMRETGGRLNPEIPKFTYNNYADLLANIPLEQNTSYGAPPHDVAHGQLQRVHPGRLAPGQPLRAEPRPALRLLRHRQGARRPRRSQSRSSTSRSRPISASSISVRCEIRSSPTTRTR